MAIHPYQDIQDIQEHYASCSQDNDKVNKIQDYFQNTDKRTNSNFQQPRWAYLFSKARWLHLPKAPAGPYTRCASQPAFWDSWTPHSRKKSPLFATVFNTPKLRFPYLYFILYMQSSNYLVLLHFPFFFLRERSIFYFVVYSLIMTLLRKKKQQLWSSTQKNGPNAKNTVT